MVFIYIYICNFEQDEMRDMLKSLKKSLDDKERAMKAAVANSVVEIVEQLVKLNIGTPAVVEILQAYDNTKALDAALKKVKSLSPETSALFLSVDPDKKKIFALSAVPKVINSIFYLTETNHYYYH